MSELPLKGGRVNRRNRTVAAVRVYKRARRAVARTAGASVFYCALRLPGRAKPVRKSTFTADRAKAEVFAGAIFKQMLKGGDAKAAGPKEEQLYLGKAE